MSENFIFKSKYNKNLFCQSKGEIWEIRRKNYLAEVQTGWRTHFVPRKKTASLATPRFVAIQTHQKICKGFRAFFCLLSFAGEFLLGFFFSLFLFWTGVCVCVVWAFFLFAISLNSELKRLLYQNSHHPRRNIMIYHLPHDFWSLQKPSISS